MPEMTVTRYAPHLAAALLLSACTTMGLGSAFDSSDVAREWQVRWDRAAWDAPKNAMVTGVTNLSCKKASGFRHARWCRFDLHYASLGSQSVLPMERWLVDRETLARMQHLRP